MLSTPEPGDGFVLSISRTNLEDRETEGLSHLLIQQNHILVGYIRCKVYKALWVFTIR